MLFFGHTRSELKKKGKRNHDIEGLSFPVRSETNDKIISSSLTEAVSQTLGKEKKLLEVFTFETNDNTSFVDVNLFSDSFDTWLMVISPSGKVWIDDDSGEGRNSRLLIESEQIGQWNIIATSCSASKKGSFQLRVDEIEERVSPILLVPEQNSNQIIAMANRFFLEEVRRKLAQERIERDSSLLLRQLETLNKSSNYRIKVKAGPDRRNGEDYEAVTEYLRHRDRIHEERLSRLTELTERQMRLQEDRTRGLEKQMVLLRNELSSIRTSQSEDSKTIPRFPWPPPQASALSVMPRALLRDHSGNQLTKLEQVDSRLSESLERCGYTEKRYYAVPNGFALVTKIEQIDSEGRPKKPRWSVEIGKVRNFTVESYLKALLMAPHGYFRVIAFVVTSRPFVTNGDLLTRKEADQWLIGGLNILPSSIREFDLTKDHKVTALIYEFEKKGIKGDVNCLVPGKLQGETHLKGSGLLSALRRK